MTAAVARQGDKHFIGDNSQHFIVDFRDDDLLNRCPASMEETSEEYVDLIKETLIKHSPFTNDDLLDLLYSMFEQCNLTTLSTFIQLYPKILTQTNRQGKIPLHELVCWSRVRVK